MRRRVAERASACAAGRRIWWTRWSGRARTNRCGKGRRKAVIWIFRRFAVGGFIHGQDARAASSHALADDDQIALDAVEHGDARQVRPAGEAIRFEQSQAWFVV